MRLGVVLLVLLLGAGTGIATVALHDLVWGLALGVAATVVTVVALPPGWRHRLAFVVGWDAVVGWSTPPRPEGDYVISQDWQGYAVLVLGMLLLVAGLATLPRPRRQTAPLP